MNQNAEQLARDSIDRQLQAAGWVIQDKKTFNLAANVGVAILEWQTAVGPADYVLFVVGKPFRVIEAKSRTMINFLRTPAVSYRFPITKHQFP